MPVGEHIKGKTNTMAVIGMFAPWSHHIYTDNIYNIIPSPSLINNLHHTASSMQRESLTDATVTTHSSIITNVTVVPELSAETTKIMF